MIRYLVTDRQRRRFSKAVAQYVSPAMARRIGESNSNLSFAPGEAVVSCLFSDLAGFTRLSEKLGPAGTRAVLNPYLESMSSALHRHNALINKFMGDGIFAFFNPPILPCPAHEIAACEAALDSRKALAELIARHAGTPLAESFGQLAMRMGIASGRVFVGDYGSESKLDYTCVGDVVNLAARLESANKQFGTAILVSGPTRVAAGTRFLFRHLGMVRVQGQARGEAIYELLGRRGEVDGILEAHAELFDHAVLAFSSRDWTEAVTGFEECLQYRPDDLAAQRYLPIIRHCRQNPPPDDWSGIVELTEK
jgi:adenylate cyclase